MSTPETTIGTAPAETVERVLGPPRRSAALARGDLASVRVLLGIAVIWTIFQIANDRFLSAVNLSNLTLQIAAIATISIGVVLVLLLGEIDLSVGAVSGLAAGVMAVLTVQHGWSPVLAIVAGLGVGHRDRPLQRLHRHAVRRSRRSSSRSRACSPGRARCCWVLGDTGSVNLPPSVITDLTSTFFDPAVGWILAIAGIAAYAAAQLLARRRRAAAGLEMRAHSRAWSLKLGAGRRGDRSRRSRSSTPTAASRSRR